MEIVSVILDYFVWLLPVLVVGAFLYKRLTTPWSGYHVLFSAFILLIFITIKDAYSIYIHANISLPIYALIDAGFVLGIATILSYGSSKIKRRFAKKYLLSKGWRIAVSVLYMLSISTILYASFTKGIFFFIDFTEYATALFMLITLSLFVPVLIKIRHRMIFSLLVSIPLLCDLYLRLYVFWQGISGEPWFFLRTIRFSLRCIAVITIFAVLFGYLRKGTFKRAISFIKEKRLLLPVILGMIIVTILLFVIYTSFFNYTNLVKNEKKIYADNSLQDLNTFSTLISISFRSIAEKMVDLSALPVIKKLDNTDEVRKALKSAMVTSPSYVKSMSRVDKHGILRVTYPFTSVEGTDISYQPHIKKIIEEHVPVISAPIMSVQGFMSLIIHYPVFEGNKFNGSVAALISIKALADYLRWNLVMKQGEIVLLDKNGLILFHSEKRYTNKYISSILNMKETSLNTLLRPGVYELRDTNGKKILAVSQKVQMIWLFGRMVQGFIQPDFYAISFIPYTNIVSSVRNILLPQYFTVFLLLAATTIIYIFHAIYTASYETHLEEEVRRQTETLESTNEEIVAMNEELESSYLRVSYLSDRLQTVLEIVLNIEVKQDVDEFLQYVLDRTVGIIDDAQKGSVMLKEKEGNFIFRASHGFDMAILDKIKIKEKDMYEYKGVEKLSHIVDVTRTRFPSYAQKDEFVRQAEKIKATLAAPLKIGNEYVGAIFIDNLESEEAFKEEDEQLLEAVSNFVSFFLNYKEVLSDLIDLYRSRGILMEFAREGLLKTRKEDILEAAYRKIKEAYGKNFSVLSWITSIDRDEQTFDVISKLEDGKTERKRFPMNTTITGRAIREGKTIFVNDVSSDPDYVELSPESKAEGVVPLKYGENIYAIAALELKQPFSIEDRRFFEEFSYTLSLLLRNCDLMNDIKKSYLQTMIALSRAIEIKDPYTRGHSERVARYAMEIGKALGMKEEDLENIRYAGLLHDIGKIGVAGKILNKNGKLTEEEYTEVKRHPVLSEEIVKDIEYLKKVRKSIRHHHERYDGRGYPDGLGGNEIPVESRILAIADAFDAMTSTRPYRDAMSVEKAVSILKSGAGKQWDPNIIDKAIEAILKSYPMFFNADKDQDTV